MVTNTGEHYLRPNAPLHSPALALDPLAQDTTAMILAHLG